MVIVLVHWKIKPNRVADFLEYWRKVATVQDRAGLIGEFLSEACHASEFPWITWDLTGHDDVHRSFINVGMWAKAEDFHDQIAKYFRDGASPQDFEHQPRVRTVLRPRCWRMGDSSLPVHDSGGTL